MFCQQNRPGEEKVLFAVVRKHGLLYIIAMEKIPMDTGKECRPQINYPCVWQYKVIVTDVAPVRSVISEHLGDAPYSLSESKRSSGGKYISLNLELTVHSDYHRLRLYEVLSAHPAVRVIL